VVLVKAKAHCVVVVDSVENTMLSGLMPPAFGVDDLRPPVTFLPTDTSAT
jgi:hypothetical protein